MTLATTGTTDITRGLYSNALFTAWSSILGLCAVPLLLRALGLESYALVALLLTMQALLMALDMGLSSTVNRFVASYLARQELAQARNLIASLNPVYAVVGILVIVLGFMLSDYLAANWLQLQQLTTELVSTAFCLIACIVAVRWWLALYQQALIGAGRVDLSSRIGIVTVTLAQAGGVAMAFATEDLRFYLAWVLACTCLQFVLLYLSAWRVLGGRHDARAQWRSLRSVWGFSAAMAGVSLTGVVLMQADRVLLSRTQALEDFGVYGLAWTLTTGLYVILTPTFNVIAPRLTATYAQADSAVLEAEYRRFSRVFFAVLFPIVCLGVVASSDLLQVWVGEGAVAGEAAMLFGVLLVATGMNGVMHFPYALQLAAGRSDLALKINLMLCVLHVPALFLLASSLGMLGAALAWLLTNSAYCLIGLPITRRAIRGHPGIWSWLRLDLAPPLMVSLGASGAVAFTCKELGLTGLWAVLIAASTGLVCVLFSLRVFSGLSVRDLHWPAALDSANGANDSGVSEAGRINNSKSNSTSKSGVNA
ncbi:MAG: lipopolysaccharide biosynthesis protein [Congregibacter sp.]